MTTGCAGVRDPSIALHDAALLGSNPEGCTMRLTLELVNPNREPLELRTVDYAVRADGREVFAGRRAAEATIPARGRAELALPVVIPHARAGWPGAPPPDFAVSVRGTLKYTSPGELAEALLDAGVRRPRVSFSLSGRITAPGSTPTAGSGSADAQAPDPGA